MILLHGQNEDPYKAQQMFDDKVSKDIKPSANVYGASIKVYLQNMDIDSAQKIIINMNVDRFTMDKQKCMSLAGFYLKNNEPAQCL